MVDTTVPNKRRSAIAEYSVERLAEPATMLGQS